jgi:hypothetical protein
MNSSSGRSILILLIVLLVSGISAFGQPKLLPPPDFVKVADQPGSPLTIALPERHEFDPYFNPVSYTIRNDSQKSIRSVVVTGFPKDPYHAVGLGSLQPGATRSLSHGDLNARKPDEMFTLSVDFVLFTDGTRWGADKAGESEFVFGFIDGQRRFYDDAKKVIDADDEQALIDFLAKPGGIPEFGIPPEKRSKRQDGFARGFSYWKNTLAFDIKNRGNLKGVPAKIADLERELEILVQQKHGTRRIGRAFQFNEPIKLTELRLGDRVIAFDENYIAVSDWLKGMTINARNDSEKTLVHLSLKLDFPETTKSGNGMVSWLRYGKHPTILQIGKDEERPADPGQNFQIRLDEKELLALKRFIESRQPLNDLTQVTISLENVYYSDGTMWSGGHIRKPDPNDPKRWIPID